MSTNLVRYTGADGPAWGAVRGTSVVPLPAEYVAVADVLSDGVKVARSLIADPDIPFLPLAGLHLLHPVPDARIFCQGANYRAHMIESGMDPDRAFNLLFTKSTASLTGPDDDIERPAHVRLLDYEVELGIVLGKAITGPVTVTEENLAEYVGAFVVADDVSARDVQLPQGQWYKGKSYATFCPVGPYLCIPEPDEVARWRELRLTLSVNGAVRQDSLAGDMVFGPAETLTEWSGSRAARRRRSAAHRHPGRRGAAAAARPRAARHGAAARPAALGAVRAQPVPQRRLPSSRATGSRPRSGPPTVHSTSAPSTTACGDVMATTHVPVVIVGAGPTGASAAIMLAQRGIECLLLDRWRDVYPLPRAVHFDDEVFRIFGRMGIAEQVRAISRPLPGMQLVDGHHRVLAELTRDPSGQVHGYPAANMFHQPELEHVLRDRLAELPQVDFRGNVEVIAVEQGAHGEEPVRVRYRDLVSGTETEVWADAVLGCDGANSITRTAVGATMEDLGFSQEWLVVDVARPSRSTSTTASSRSATTTAPPRSCG